MAHYAITMTDGSVTILQTVGEATAEECLAKWPPAEKAKIVSHREINPSAIPTDRTYRDAWTDNGKAIVHDAEKVKAIDTKRAKGK